MAHGFNNIETQIPIKRHFSGMPGGIQCYKLYTLAFYDFIR